MYIAIGIGLFLLLFGIQLLLCLRVKRRLLTHIPTFLLLLCGAAAILFTVLLLGVEITDGMSTGERLSASISELVYLVLAFAAAAITAGGALAVLSARLLATLLRRRQRTPTQGQADE